MSDEYLKNEILKMIEFLKLFGYDFVFDEKLFGYDWVWNKLFMNNYIEVSEKNLFGHNLLDTRLRHTQNIFYLNIFKNKYYLIIFPLYFLWIMHVCLYLVSKYLCSSNHFPMLECVLGTSCVLGQLNSIIIFWSRKSFSLTTIIIWLIKR